MQGHPQFLLFGFVFLVAVPRFFMKIKDDGIDDGFDQSHRAGNADTAGQNIGDTKCDAEMQKRINTENWLYSKLGETRTTC